jgi:hypothetical protein
MLGIESLEARLALAAHPVISEFLADNDDGLRDGDGNSSDWVELYNAGDEAIDLAGWHLSDSADNLGKWTFPSVVLPAAEHLLVFEAPLATGVVDSAGFLHANFRLNAGGGFLALVAPDMTIASTVDAAGLPPGYYPPQTEDVSFGAGWRQTIHPLVSPNNAAQVLVPAGAESLASDSLGRAWTAVDYQPSPAAGWRSATAGVGFATATEYPLVAYWPLDEGAGQIIHDRSGHGYDGVLGSSDQQEDADPEWRVDEGGSSGTTTGAEGRGTVLSFGEASGGASQWVDLSAHAAAFADLREGTIAAWIRSPATDASPQQPDVIFAGSNANQDASELRLYVDTPSGGGAARFAVRQEGDDDYELVTSAPTSVRDGLWKHVAITVDEDGIAQLYVNGVVAGRGDEAGFFDAIDTLTTLSLGRNVDDSGGQWFFQGQMSDVAVWNEPLPADQIARLATGASPLRLHTFNELAPTDLADAMFEHNASAFSRTTFTVDDPAVLETLALDARYDDGFVAYLNGVEIVRRNAPPLPAWDSAALAERDNADAVAAERINVTPYLDLLRGAGQPNVLAVQMLNAAADEGDFLWLPDLIASDIATLGPRYFTHPTPGDANDSGFEGLAVAPTASVARGFFEAPFQVSLVTATPDATIRYTTDGSAPSATSGTVYTTPLTIAHTTNLRAAAFRTNYAASSVLTESYLFLRDVATQTGAGFPAGADYDVDPAIAASSAGIETLVESLESLPTISLSISQADMFGPGGIFTNSSQHGDAWERSVSAEMLLPDGSTAFQIDAGLRMHGGASRTNSPKRSFRLYFREQWGPEKLDYPLFGGDAASVFDVLVLRGGYNDIWTSSVSSSASDIANVNAQYIRDEWGRQTQAAMGYLSPHGTWAHLFIDGLYWGLYNIAERPDENFAASYQGGDEDDYDVLAHNLSLGGPRIVAGDRTAWDAMNAILAGDIATDEAYAATQQYLDVVGFADYMILNLYAGNRDWPHNNWYASRPRTADGKFQFYVWDGEMMLGYVDEDRRLTTAALDSPGYIYDRLRLNAEFRQLFADRVEKWMTGDGALAPQQSAARYAQIAATIAPAMAAEAARWGDYEHPDAPLTAATWQAVIADKLANYFPQRGAEMFEQFESIDLLPTLAAPIASLTEDVVEHGSRLELSVADGALDDLPGGAIYYTTDGSDPRAPSVQQTVRLVRDDATKRYLIPTVDNGGATLDAAWRGGATFDDSAWTEAFGGIGYDDTEGLIHDRGVVDEDVGDVMRDGATSAYVRMPLVWTGVQPGGAARLVLRVRYDDGFAAYLNGVEIAAAGVSDELTFDSTAIAMHGGAAAVGWSTFDVTPFAHLLVRGNNVLAVQGVNYASDDGAFLISAELDAEVSYPAAPAKQARRYVDPIALFESQTVKSRAFDGVQWSPLVERHFVVESPLRLSEVMYHPSDPTAAERAAGFDDADDFEFVEIVNIGFAPVSLAGVRLVGEVEFALGAGQLAPGERGVVVRNPAAFAQRYGAAHVRILGEYDAANDDAGVLSQLSNSGGLVQLVDSDGLSIVAMHYSDHGDLPTAADGAGRSLVPIVENAAAASHGVVTGWRASYRAGGSPGGRDRLPGDLDADGSVGLRDLIMLRDALGTTAQTESNVAQDSNGDGTVDRRDLAMLLAQFGMRDAAAPYVDVAAVLAPPPAVVVATSGESSSSSASGIGSAAAVVAVRRGGSAALKSEDEAKLTGAAIGERIRLLQRRDSATAGQTTAKRLIALRFPAPTAVDTAILAQVDELRGVRVRRK